MSYPKRYYHSVHNSEPNNILEDDDFSFGGEKYPQYYADEQKHIVGLLFLGGKQIFEDSFPIDMYYGIGVRFKYRILKYSCIYDRNDLCIPTDAVGYKLYPLVTLHIGFKIGYIL